MVMTLNRQAFQQVVDEDLAWLAQQPRTLERDHVEQLVRDAVEQYYARPLPAITPYYDAGGVTLYHADCFDVLPTLSNIGAIVTDSPYSSGGQFRGDRMRTTVEKYTQTGTAAYRPEFGGDNRDQRSYLAWCSLWLAAAKNASQPGAVVVSFIDWRNLPTMTDAVQAGGFIWRGIGVWSKKYGRPRPNGFSSACEFMVWGTNGPTLDSDPAVYPAGIVECQAPPSDEREHVAQKPEKVMDWACSIAPSGGILVDPFMGSGTTLVVAKARGLRCIGIDIDEANCEITARRLAQESLPFEAV
jgi:site-specific DNA-methyltransferase (adenine-specific)